ncbi:DUF455 family protein [Leptospira sp. GIMC2001]|uniref:DUF455 family protein n=1 Tax=Leptospira sp. GIMC2001 TaxID=1513297 RepID=UPI00234AB9DC|nr:DUF455 family protein [Leptospira sp. GIMC2001]WCL48809.1 DUF455 family protein [Leptospira sp. GIMC2001]
MKTYAQYAEWILRSPNLEDKLLPPPEDLFDDRTDKFVDSQIIASAPEREYSIRMSDEKSKIPRLEHLNNPRNIAVSLHHFANHELMATELFAWALLKFPKAGPGTRRGFLKSLIEEQYHFKLYRERMQELGLGFGDKPLNRLFWKQLPRIQTLEKFTAVISMSFEGANLDFTKIYKQAFSFHGDDKSADIMNIVYEDEIKHVKRGLAVFNKTKPESLSDWEYYNSLIEYPFTPRRAKAYHFYPETRKRAGFSDSFIDDLQNYEDIYTGRVSKKSLEKVGI